MNYNVMEKNFPEIFLNKEKVSMGSGQKISNISMLSQF